MISTAAPSPFGTSPYPAARFERRRFLHGTRPGRRRRGPATAGARRGPRLDRRNPDPDIIALDNRFKAKLGNAPVQRVYHSPNMLWAEGPAWNGVGRYLLWSDILNSAREKDSLPPRNVTWSNPAPRWSHVSSPLLIPT